jgi:hypothetical protein
MKKLILSVTAIAGLSLAGHAQGIFLSDGTFTTGDTTIAGVANTTQDLNLELLYGSSSANVTTPVVTLLLSSSASPANGALGGTYAAAQDITGLGGVLNDASGTGYLVPAGTQDFIIEAWTGNYSSYQAALASGVTGEYAGVSQIFSASVPAAPNTPTDVSSMGIINLTQVPTTIVPEPSTLAMAGVGLASMLMFRRKNS